MKKIITIIAVVLATSFIATAQTPKPPVGNNNDTEGHGATIKDGAVRGAKGPVGTATALLLSLGAGTVAYKVRKNKKAE